MGQQATAGYLSVWYMNGPSFSSSAFLWSPRVADTNWKVRLR